MPALAPLLDCLFPDDCPGCGGPRGTTGSTAFCAACAAELPRMLRPYPSPEVVRTTWILGPYAGPLGGAIRRVKYRPDQGLARELATRLASAADTRLPQIDEVVHVPVPLRRRLVRGFDQAEVLAAAVSQILDVPHRARLRRLVAAEQAGRSARDRRSAARLAFEYRWRSGLPCSRVLLVDDVLTTGATAAACADALLDAGASEVHLLCIAAGHA